MGGGAFSEGKMRLAYHFKDLARLPSEQDWVAKVPKAASDSVVSAFVVDAQMQSLCQFLAEAFNACGPPKSVQFLEAGVMELVDEPVGGRNAGTLFAVERLLQGRYE